MIIQKKKNRKKLIIIIVSIILLFLIIIVVTKMVQHNKQQKYFEQEKLRVSQYTSLTDFKTLEEVAIYLNCTFIKQEEVKNESVQYKVYMKLPVTYNSDSTDNKNFTENLIQYSAYVLKYKNFCIIDEENKTNIVVYCNEENELIETYYINGTENYWGTNESRSNIENYKEISEIEVNVSSEELKQIVSNNWSAANANLGTAESTYRSYNIYFDEGYQIRNVNKKVFNIVFTDKYKNAIVNNLTTNSSIEEIEKSLGKPQFESGSLIGYKAKNMYIFFYKNQVSIYKVEEYETEKIAEIIEKHNPNYGETSFIDEIRAEWKDYDIFEYDNNYVKLQYTLKGLTIKYDSSSKRGVILYNNYAGKFYGNRALQDVLSNQSSMPENTYFENEDLVFLEEQNRINTLDDTTANNNYATTIIRNISKQFKVAQSTFKSDNSLYNVRFISINNQSPNTELREPISFGLWYDDSNFIYSVKNRGIFIYNVKSQEYKTLKKGNENYILLRIESGKLYYDSTAIDVEI